MHKPRLESTQFALLVADGFTGHVLNTSLEIYKNDESAVYFVFNDLPSVNAFIENLNESNDAYEYSIYNSGYVLVKYMSARKWS